jgi:hypothetical protein
MAVLPKSGPAMCGVYVGESAASIWLGQVIVTGSHGDKDKGRIIELPRSSVDRSVIGSSVALHKLKDTWRNVLMPALRAPEARWCPKLAEAASKQRPPPRAQPTP